MKDNGKNTSMTFEEALADPSLAHIHDFIRRVQTTPASQLIPKKHANALTSFSVMETRELFKIDPNMPIKKVITTIFESLTDDIPAPLMLKLTEKIIDVWSELSATAQQNKQPALAA